MQTVRAQVDRKPEVVAQSTKVGCQHQLHRHFGKSLVRSSISLLRPRIEISNEGRVVDLHIRHALCPECLQDLHICLQQAREQLNRIESFRRFTQEKQRHRSDEYRTAQDTEG